MIHLTDILIVGGGHAGAQAAIALRQQKFEGSITIVGDEPDLPYERPPLSKDYLAQEKSFERILIRPPGFWAERDIALLSGRRINTVVPGERIAVDDTGERYEYGKLIWAGGGAPRRLTGAGCELAGIHYVRTRADVDALMAELGAASRIVVVGGGYIGLEAAAVLSKLGKHVTVLESQDRVLARVAGVALSRFFEAEHRAHGVDIRLGVALAGIEGADGKCRAVRLASGEMLEADIVVAGIGIIPAIEPLLMAGAMGDNGVDVDAYCRTSLPDVFAIGDCATHANRFAAGAMVRVESVQNANDQAATVAKFITGQEVPYEAIPWFWSNQYDLRLQTVGLSIGHDDEVLRGDPASRSFSIVYLRQGKVVALDCVNATKDFVQGKALVLAAATVAPALLADAGKSLKELAAE